MYLNDIQTVVTQSGDTYVVNYDGNGTCTYVMTRIGKRIKQEVLLLTHVDMGDVIETIHMKSPLSSKDLEGMNMEIRNDSLYRVEEYISKVPHS